MKEVTKEEYLASFTHKDAVISTVGNYPYTSEWTLRGSREVIAKAVNSLPEGKLWPVTTKYYIKN